MPSWAAGDRSWLPRARLAMPTRTWHGHRMPVDRMPSPRPRPWPEGVMLAVMLAAMTATESGLPGVGQPAPDFKLASTDDKDVSLADFKGKQPVVLYFY